VKSCSVLSEKSEAGILFLQTQCVVSKELSEEEARKLMRTFSCVVGFTMEIDGGEVDDDRLANKISSDLVHADFDVRDIQSLADLKGYQPRLEAALERQDLTAARWIGRQMLSNVVVVGKAKLKLRERKEVTSFAGVIGVYIYDGWLDAKAIETESGRIIAQHATQIEGVQGSGDTPQKAVTDALTRLANNFSKELIAQLDTYAGKKSRPITIEIQGLPSLEEYQKVKQMLNNVRFRDSEVQDVGFEAGKISAFRFNYAENINMIALKLDHVPTLTVREKTPNKVVCLFSRE
jgi:hypothetical protein